MGIKERRRGGPQTSLVLLLEGRRVRPISLGEKPGKTERRKKRGGKNGREYQSYPRVKVEFH